MRTLALLALVLLAGGPADAAREALELIVDFENSKGVEAGASVRSQTVQIGEVTGVGFGPRDTVEVRLRIDAEHREEVRTSSTFVIHEKREGEPAWIEHFVIDPAKPPAANDERLAGARSEVEVWLRRGRINAEELNRALERGVDEFRSRLDELQRSPEWAKFRDQLAKLGAELTATGNELSRLLQEQLPKLQQQLDELHRRYQDELRRRESGDDDVAS